jgi:hypothetical protein
LGLETERSESELFSTNTAKQFDAGDGGS